MFYRWVRRLESMQMPATSFPGAGGDPAVETEELHELDGALIAATVASLWLLVQSRWSDAFVGVEWALFVYAPIVLVAVLGALIVRPDTSPASIALHLTAYAALAALLGAMRATSPLEAVVLGGFFALIGLVTAVLCVVVWAVATHEIARPGTALHSHAPAFRLLCGFVILSAALQSANTVISPLTGI